MAEPASGTEKFWRGSGVKIHSGPEWLTSGDDGRCHRSRPAMMNSDIGLLIHRPDVVCLPMLSFGSVDGDCCKAPKCRSVIVEGPQLRATDCDVTATCLGPRGFIARKYDSFAE
jgi:hypothetical protein